VRPTANHDAFAKDGKKKEAKIQRERKVRSQKWAGKKLPLAANLK